MNVAFLHVRGSIDDAIWANIGAKLGNIGQVRLGKPCSKTAGTVRLQLHRFVELALGQPSCAQA